MTGHHISLITDAGKAVSAPVVSTINIFTESRTILSLKWKWKRKIKTETNENPNPKPIIPRHLPLLKINIEYTSTKICHTSHTGAVLCTQSTG